MPEHEQKDTMTDNDQRPPQFAEPPNATVHIADLHHSARIPCTRDDNTHDSDPIAAETWAFALGLAIGRHGPHWARTFARSIVRVHIAEGWLEVFLHEIEEPINAPLDLDHVFACFTEAWKTIAIDQDDTRWCDHEAVTLYAWDSAIHPQEGDPSGAWIAERDGMDTDTMAAYRIRKTAIEIATNAAYADGAYHSADGTTNDILLFASEMAAATFMDLYSERTDTPISLATGDMAKTALAMLDEPWRSALIEAIAVTQETLLAKQRTLGTDADEPAEGQTIQ